MSVNVGYRVLPHTADTRIEAWAPARAACLEAAVRAFVSTFANVVGAEVTDSIEESFAEPTDEDLLVAVLEQVIYLVEVAGVVPVSVDLADENDGRVAGYSAWCRWKLSRSVGRRPKQ